MRRKFFARTAAAGAAVAALFTVVVPTGTSSAISKVPCGPSDYLYLEMHYFQLGKPGTQIRRLCLATAGTYQISGGKYTYWLDQISTGNNQVTYHDANGTNVALDKWRVQTYKSHPKKIDNVTIL